MWGVAGGRNMVSLQLTDEGGQGDDESADRMVGGGHTSWLDTTLNLRQTPHLPSANQGRRAADGGRRAADGGDGGERRGSRATRCLQEMWVEKGGGV